MAVSCGIYQSSKGGKRWLGMKRRETIQYWRKELAKLTYKEHWHGQNLHNVMYSPGKGQNQPGHELSLTCPPGILRLEFFTCKTAVA